MLSVFFNVGEGTGCGLSGEIRRLLIFQHPLKVEALRAAGAQSFGRGFIEDEAMRLHRRVVGAGPSACPGTRARAYL